MTMTQIKNSSQLCLKTCMHYFTLEDREHALVLHSIAKLKIDKVIYFQYHLIDLIMDKKKLLLIGQL
jgi:hypothetical protein